jgi:hypothetical protein
VIPDAASWAVVAPTVEDEVPSGTITPASKIAIVSVPIA